MSQQCNERPILCFIKRTAGQVDAEIVYCPLHAAAPRLLSALDSIIDQACGQGCPEYWNRETGDTTAEHTEECRTVRALLRELKPEPTAGAMKG